MQANSPLDRFHRGLDPVDADDGNFARDALGAQRFKGPCSHVVVRGPYPLDLVAEAREPEAVISKASFDCQLPAGSRAARPWVFFEVCSCPCGDRRPPVGDHAADGDDAACVADRLEQFFGDVAAVGDAVELDVRDIVRIEIGGVKIGGLVPPGDD